MTRSTKYRAVKLGREVGFSKAAEELGIPTDTIYGWNKAAKTGRLDLGSRKFDSSSLIK